MRREDDITAIKGIGPKTAEQFHACGIETIDDLLHDYPRTYVTYDAPLTTQDVQDGYHAALDGCIKGSLSVRRMGKKSVTTGRFGDLFGEIRVVWFNMPYLKQSLLPGRRIILWGRIRRNGTVLEMEQPQIFTPEAYAEKRKVRQPVYSLAAGMKNSVLQRALKTCIFEDPEVLASCPEDIPERIRKAYDLLSCAEALRGIHFPEDDSVFAAARRRLVFEEFLLFLLSLGTEGSRAKVESNAYAFPEESMAVRYRRQLPFALTAGQETAWEEIHADMTGPQTMNRLVQGDVGSGKTVLAVMALLLAAGNGYQGAMMAPTEVLACQHYESISSELERAGIPVKTVLLTGSMTAAKKREARERIASGEAQIIIGTHALIQEAVEYRNLALVITDEQHRFGVRQREVFREKGCLPHMLVMSATPIPRTLALILYGDLSVSTIRELPKERLPIKNCAVDTGYRKKAYRFILEQIREGRQAYIICPLVEANEEVDGEDVETYANRLRTVFPENVEIGMLHGRMKPAEKNRIMTDFAENRLQILVSTTVVEVGVNVPNATVMMVENAESFGLSALHQLRGRVGRGRSQSYCIFVSGKKGKDQKARLDTLVRTNDGFEVAETDLAMRGPGEMLGVRQSGELGFRIGDILADADVLREADKAAKEILTADPELRMPENRCLKENLIRYSSDRVVL